MSLSGDSNLPWQIQKTERYSYPPPLGVPSADSLPFTFFDAFLGGGGENRTQSFLCVVEKDNRQGRGQTTGVGL